MSRVARLFAGPVAIQLLASCGNALHTTLDANPAGAEPVWALFPSVPTGCLSDANCRFGRGGSSLETSVKLYDDWNGRPSSNKSLLQTNEKSLASDRAVAELYRKAHIRALDAQDPSGNLQKKVSSEVQGPPQLPPQPAVYSEEVDAYRKSDEYLKCQTSYYALLDGQSSIKEGDSEKPLVMLKLYSRYVERCFSSAPPALLSRIALFTTAWQTSRPSKVEGIYCLGFAIDEKRVITAKHCLADPNALSLIREGARPNTKVTLRPWVNSRIVFADDPKAIYSYRLAALHQQQHADTFDPTALTDDIAIVELDVGRKIPPFKLAKQKEWDRILTFTSFYPAEQMLKCNTQGDAKSCSLSELIRVDNSATCVTPTRRNGCLLHACQTRPGASGGPILAMRDGEYVLIGVHTGGLDSGSNSQCQLPRAEYYRNYGIAIDTSSVVKALPNMEIME